MRLDHKGAGNALAVERRRLGIGIYTHIYAQCVDGGVRESLKSGTPKR